MKKLSIILLFSISISCFTLCANEKTNDEQVIFLDISKNNSFNNELRMHYDKIELRFIRGSNYSDGYGEDFFIVERLTYYGIKNDKKYLLGSVTIDGIFDKDSNLLKKTAFPSQMINIGLSSTTLDYPWEPSYALKNTKRKNEISNTDPFAYININFSTNSLIISEPEY